MRSILTLIVAVLGFWALVSVPAHYLLGGELTYVYSGTAMLLCLVPAVLTMLWANSSAHLDPGHHSLIILGGTSVRMFGVLIVAFLLHRNVALYREEGGFLLWLVVFYMFTLAVEMNLLLANRPRTHQSA